MVYNRRCKRVQLYGHERGVGMRVISINPIQLRAIGYGPCHVEHGEVGAVELMEGNQGCGLGHTPRPRVYSKLSTAKHILQLLGDIGCVVLNPCT